MAPITFLVGIALASWSPKPQVTMASLLAELTNRDTMASYPSPEFGGAQASSYDRTQTNPLDSKTWFNNQDYGQFIRTEQHQGHTEWVVMDHEGPGAVTRIWTPLLADKNRMRVRFYFNGSDVPTIEENFNDLLRGNGRIKSPFAFIAWPDPKVTDGVGADLYFPIPFTSGCKVTLSEEPFYYSIGYRAYKPGTRVNTFTWSDYDALKSRIDAVGRQLPFDSTPRATDSVKDKARLRSGDSVQVRLPKGSRAISQIELEVPRTISSQSLRSTILEVTFDGNQTVWCPIGDFFGCGINLRAVTDRYRRVTEKGKLECSWAMPYRKSCTVRLVNTGQEETPLSIYVRTKPWQWTDRSMLFHANWHHDYPLATRPMTDWNYLEATGKGVYVGDTLTVMNPSSAWYGEGDEKVYVDGEKFPSQLGTGTEDYYGYAWGMAEQWSSAFMSMPARDIKGRENWMGFTTTSRVRGLDEIPFSRSLKFDMEVWHWADCKVEYSAATFWYARLGATSNRVAAPIESARPLPEVSIGVKGAIEFEGLEVIQKSPGMVTSTQSGGISVGSWSAGQQLFLQAQRVGDFVEIRLPVAHPGRQHVWLYATKSYDYGISQFSINGRIAKEVDLWTPIPSAFGPIDLGVFDLAGKGAMLRVEITGTNPKSTGPRFYSGLDCAVLKP